MAQPGRTGMQVVTPGVEPIVADIIFVHGLQGDAVETWSQRAEPTRAPSPFKGFLRFRQRGSRDHSRLSVSETHSGSVFWPADLLSQDMQHLRLLTYGYSSDVIATFRSVSQNNIMQHAQNLVGDVLRERDNVHRRATALGASLLKSNRHDWHLVLPLTNVSLGSPLIVGSDFQPRQQRLSDETHGIIFLGTPHRGSQWAPWAKLATNLAKLALQAPSTKVLQALQVDSAVLQIIADEFSKMVRSDKIKVYSFREEKGMSGLYGFDAKIVDDFSSMIGDAAEGQEGIDANHTGMCKFSERDDPGYKKVLGVIKDFTKDAQGLNADAPRDRLKEELAKLPLNLQSRLLIDRQHNNIRVTEGSEAMIVDLPLLDEAAFETTRLQLISTPDSRFGSCAFELADLLQLRPGQSRSQYFKFESCMIHEALYDEKTYYCRCSRIALLRFICQHFVSIWESPTQVLVQTDVALFTLIQTDRRLLVRVNTKERQPTTKAPGNQDFHALKKIAEGSWCFREGDEIDYGNGFALRRGSIFLWRDRFDVPSPLLCQNIAHQNCIYFFKQTDFAELELRMDFAYEVSEAMLWVAERKENAFLHMTESLATLSILNTKRLVSSDSLGIHIAVVKLLIADAMKQEGDQPGPIPSDRGIHFVTRSMRLYDSLLDSFRVVKSRDVIQQRLIADMDYDAQLVAAQAGLALLHRGNAQFILNRAVAVPTMWLELLSAAEGDVYVR